MAKTNYHVAVRKKRQVSLSELFEKFLKTKENKDRTQYHHYRRICELTIETYPNLTVEKFSPQHLKAIRNVLIARQHNRRSINARMKELRSPFKWGTEEELVPIGIYAALQAVKPLLKNESIAPESSTRCIIPEQHINAILDQLQPIPAAMVRTQLTLACRPSEVFLLRIENINRLGDIWEIIFREHKTSASIGPKTLYVPLEIINILMPIIDGRKTGYVFRPSESTKGTRNVNEHYNANSYRQTIVRACKRAGIPNYFPYQLRHTGITNIGLKYGMTAAQHAACHTDPKMTTVYFHGQDEIRKQLAIAMNATVPSPAPPNNPPTPFLRIYRGEETRAC